MAKRLDADIRAFAETMQARRDAAGERVKGGEIQHLRFIDRPHCEQRAEENLHKALTGAEQGPEHLADCAAYGLAAIAKGRSAGG